MTLDAGDELRTALRRRAISEQSCRVFRERGWEVSAVAIEETILAPLNRLIARLEAGEPPPPPPRVVQREREKQRDIDFNERAERAREAKAADLDIPEDGNDDDELEDGEPF